jgi:hypothetical protein
LALRADRGDAPAGQAGQRHAEGLAGL